MMIDIDHFKMLNDVHGHQAGDFVLKKSAAILTSELRGDDVIARYGGEELVVMLPRMDLKGSYMVAERIRKLFENSLFEFEGKDLKITVSAGVSAFDPSKKADANKDLLIKHADKALYEAKGKGRNKVMISDI
jgi:diguanylate cyclase (GGDEF)-like protein